MKQVIQKIQDPRQSSHGTRYCLEDIVLSAFSVFFIQCESFLAHQHQIHSRFGQDNAQTLFGIANLPSNPQLRNVLDKVSEGGLIPMFRWLYQTFHQSGFFQSYEVLDHQLLVTLDDTQYFSSHQIHCDQCHEKRMEEIAAAGRCRWKTENENHNVLKTKGYHIEENFGHGSKHLSKTLLRFMLADKESLKAADSS